MLRYRLLSAVAVLAAMGAETVPPAWQTCSLTEGKGDGCGAGDAPRKFDEYLTPGRWAQPIHQDWFYGDFEWDLKRIEPTHLRVTWADVGSFGPHRIREVRYRDGRSDFATVLLAEGNPGFFSPLIKWSGRMPGTEFYETDGSRILVLQKDSGANIPVVMTWAWVWTKRGPVRLNVDAAFWQAIGTLASGRSAYMTGLDWKTLELHTYTWPADNYPGKIGVSEKLDAKFGLRGTHLVVTGVEFCDSEGKISHWP
jgi:hypothetical protein